MEVAIHKNTGKIVTIQKLLTSLEWIGKERDEFIAPSGEIGNILELRKRGIETVEVTFVKAHSRIMNGEEYHVTSHFRIITEGAIENVINESEEHQLAKEKIYDLIFKDALLVQFNGKIQKVQSLGEIEDIFIEKSIYPKRVDVLVVFKRHHALLGRGIAFEIQISQQERSKTFERSYDRASQGFSVVWIWSSDIRSEACYNLLVYGDALKKYQEFLVKDFHTDIQNAINRKSNTIYEIEHDIKQALLPLNIKKELITHEIKEKLSQLQKINQNLDIKTNEEIITAIKNNINPLQIQELILKNITEQLDGRFEKAILEEKTEWARLVSLNFEKIAKEKIDALNISKLLDEKRMQLTHNLNNINFKEILLNHLEEKNLSFEITKIIESKINSILPAKLDELNLNFKKALNDFVEQQGEKELAKLYQKLKDEQDLKLNTSVKAFSLSKYMTEKIELAKVCEVCKELKSIFCFEKGEICRRCLDVEKND